MTSPALCVYDDNYKLNFLNCKHFGYTKTTKKFTYDNIFINKPDEFSSSEQRFDFISNWACNIIDDYNADFVGMEGYSYGSKSNRLFEIGENGGVLKNKLFLRDKKLEIFAPSDIKKCFTNKGNANKTLMYEILKDREQIDLGKNTSSPVSDIIDAYAIVTKMVKQQ